MRRIAPITITFVAALTLALPAGASANAISKIYYRCGHGESIGGFSAHAYREALRHMETEMAEYTECAELISEAELAAAAHRPTRHDSGKGGFVTPGGGKGGSGGGGPRTARAIGNHAIPTGPAERGAVHKAQSGSAPVQVAPQGAGGAPAEPIQPGVVHTDLASAASAIPAPLLAMLALLAAIALATAGRVIVLSACSKRHES